MRMKPKRGGACANARILAGLRRLVVSGGAAIPRRATQRRQMTGPHAARREGALHPRDQPRGAVWASALVSQGLREGVFVERIDFRHQCLAIRRAGD